MQETYLAGSCVNEECKPESWAFHRLNIMNSINRPSTIWTECCQIGQVEVRNSSVMITQALCNGREQDKMQLKNQMSFNIKPSKPPYLFSLISIYWLCLREAQRGLFLLTCFSFEIILAGEKMLSWTTVAWWAVKWGGKCLAFTVDCTLIK